MVGTTLGAAGTQFTVCYVAALSVQSACDGHRALLQRGWSEAQMAAGPVRTGRAANAVIARAGQACQPRQRAKGPSARRGGRLVQCGGPNGLSGAIQSAATRPRVHVQPAGKRHNH